MYETVPCNICNSNNYRVKFQSLKIDEVNPVHSVKNRIKSDSPEVQEAVDEERSYGAFHGVDDQDQVVQCLECGLIYANPRVKWKILLRAYVEEKDEHHVSQCQGRISTFRRGLRLVEKHAPSKGRLLDVGCAAGFFLKVAEESGWETYGVEPNIWFADYGNTNLELNIAQGTLQEVDFASSFFDVITLWDVLEHSPDPRTDLEEVYRLLKPGGLLLINYPDISTLPARLAGKRWWFLHSFHLYYFTPPTIRRLLRETGFQPFLKKVHIQELDLGYLILRLKTYSAVAHKVLDNCIRLFHLENLKVPYYASQITVMAKKVEQ